MTDAVATVETPVKPATDAVSLKRFFKEYFGIPVRVQTGTSKNPYICAWIPSQKRQPGEPFNAPIRYAHSFTPEFGNLCLRVIYGDSPTSQQSWAGNVMPNMVSMHRCQWEEVITAVIRQKAEKKEVPSA